MGSSRGTNSRLHHIHLFTKCLSVSQSLYYLVASISQFTGIYAVSALFSRPFTGSGLPTLEIPSVPIKGFDLPPVGVMLNRIGRRKLTGLDPTTDSSYGQAEVIRYSIDVGCLRHITCDAIRSIPTCPGMYRIPRPSYYAYGYGA